jgi:hypothetical protein
MEQRRLRLGDILDDYCPRERRVTNHAIVAMIEEDIKQTRCTTCDAEHAYKGARVPKRRKKDEPLVAAPERGVPEPQLADLGTAAVEDDEPASTYHEERAASADAEPPIEAPADEPHGDEPAHADPVADSVEDGPVHRPLIRATLPRPEGQKDTRPLPEFTIRQNGGRGNTPFRGDRMKMRGGNPMSGNGNRANGGARFQGGRSGSGRGPAGRGGPHGGFRGGQQRHGGKKGRGGSRG